MTKTTVFFEKSASKQIKPIEFISSITNNGSLTTSELTPGHWDEIMLIESKDNVDIMLAWDERYRDVKSTCVYIGHWNDGVVE